MIIFYIQTTKIGNKTLMFYSPNIEAYGEWWFFGLIGIFLVVACFALVFDKIKKQNPDERNGAFWIYRKFVKSFKPNHWYWEFVLFSRRFFIALFTAIQFIGGDYSNLIFIVVLIIYLCLQINYKPFAYVRVNRV